MQANLEIHTIFSQHIFHELFEALLPWITWGEYFKTSFLINLLWWQKKMLYCYCFALFHVFTQPSKKLIILMCSTNISDIQSAYKIPKLRANCSLPSGGSMQDTRPRQANFTNLISFHNNKSLVMVSQRVQQKIYILGLICIQRVKLHGTKESW